MTEDRSPRASAGRSASSTDEPVVQYGAQSDDATQTMAVPTGAAAPAGSARMTAPRPRPEQRPAAATPVRPATRRARLAVKRVDPWSVLVMALLFALFLGVVLLVAVTVLYSLLDSLGVLSSINKFAQDLQIVPAGQTVLGKGRVLSITAVVAAVDVVLLTVLAALAAFLYNLCASLTGGVEVTLAERE